MMLTALLRDAAGTSQGGWEKCARQACSTVRTKRDGITWSMRSLLLGTIARQFYSASMSSCFERQRPEDGPPTRYIN